MLASLVIGISIALAVIIIGIAAWKWRIWPDRRLIRSVVKNALKDRKAFWIGVLFAIFYLAIFMILGGKGGRIHVLFGRWIFNTTPGEVMTGLVMALLVMISMALFVYSIHIMGLGQSGKKGGGGIFGTLLALLASFCP